MRFAITIVAGTAKRIVSAGVRTSSATPNWRANASQVARPAATPSGNPTTSAAAASVVACQAVVAET